MQFPKLDKQSLTEGIVIPKMVKVRQSFPSHNLTDPIGRLKEQLQSLDKNTIENLAGKRIGITAGSRGLPHYKELMKVLCDQLKAWKAQPFVFPAMGSHAGATAEGQKAHLAQFGINEDYLGVPVLSTMDVVTVGTLDDGFPIYCDKNAYEADGIILFNKIKPHTHFKYSHESGLLKMICIGCGKHKGASAFHGRGYDSFGPNLERVAKAFLNKVNVVFSVAMVQSPSDDIAALEVIPTEKFFERDAALQTLAKEEMPRLKLPHIDVLIVDEIGKEISGTGMDPNITGRTERFSQEEAFRSLAPEIERIVILDITEASHGNGSGCGMADIVSYRFVNKMDFASVYTNCITAKSFRMALLPLYGNSAKDAIEMAMAHSFLTEPNKAKVVRIKNTLKLEEIECSTSCLEDIEGRSDMAVVSDPFTWSFNDEDNLW